MVDITNIELSRLILLDSMLLFFTALTFLCHVSFMTFRERPFSIPWLFWLFATGVSIGLATSIKLVGLFITAVVGLYTIYDLWELFGDLHLPKVRNQIFLSLFFSFVIITPSVFRSNSWRTLWSGQRG